MSSSLIVNMNKDFPVFKTSRLLLRQITEGDLENIFRGLSDPEVIKYYGVSFDTLNETKKQIEWFAELEKDETGIWWAICSPDNLMFYGAVGLYYLNSEYKKAEIGFWLIPEYWRRGIISESILLVIEYGFEIMHLNKIEAEVETENIFSKRVMQKLNFVHELTKKDCEIKNGKYISLDVYTRVCLKPSSTVDEKF
jgi:ribosomal-protein-alanine N-acetyltransferase